MWIEFLKATPPIVTILLAIYGLRAWQRDFVGKRRIELAEDVLTKFYEARELIRGIRHSMTFDNEGATCVPGTGETEEETRIYNRAYVAHERYKRDQEKFAALYALRYRSMARFGHDAGQPFNDVETISVRIIQAGLRLRRLWLQQGRDFRTEEQQQQHLQQLRNAEAIYWEGSEDPDPINEKMATIIEAIEKICRPVIDPPPHPIVARISQIFGCVSKEAVGKAKASGAS